VRGWFDGSVCAGGEGESLRFTLRCGDGSTAASVPEVKAKSLPFTPASRGWLDGSMCAGGEGEKPSFYPAVRGWLDGSVCAGGEGESLRFTLRCGDGSTAVSVPEVKAKAFVLPPRRGDGSTAAFVPEVKAKSLRFTLRRGDGSTAVCAGGEGEKPSFEVRRITECHGHIQT
jgi:hypothetical protein